jgi:hypothetical protein
MATARKAPPGYAWRQSVLPHLPRVLLLEREHDAHIVGSVGPGKRGRWIDRDSGAEFAARDDAQANVERYI